MKRRGNTVCSSCGNKITEYDETTVSIELNTNGKFNCVTAPVCSHCAERIGNYLLSLPNRYMQNKCTVTVIGPEEYIAVSLTHKEIDYLLKTYLKD